MLAHEKRQPDGSVRIFLERQGWRELFQVRVANEYATQFRDLIGWLYRPTLELWTGDHIFRILPWHAVWWVGHQAFRAWFAPARWLYRHHRSWIHVPEGEAIHWFWPRYLLPQ